MSMNDTIFDELLHLLPDSGVYPPRAGFVDSSGDFVLLTEICSAARAKLALNKRLGRESSESLKAFAAGRLESDLIFDELMHLLPDNGVHPPESGVVNSSERFTSLLEVCTAARAKLVINERLGQESGESLKAFAAYQLGKENE